MLTQSGIRLVRITFALSRGAPAQLIRRRLQRAASPPFKRVRNCYALGWVPVSAKGLIALPEMRHRRR
jgi:hypothetical protein